MDASNESGNIIYLAGGCFWGLEKLMHSLPGVLDAVSGYANGISQSKANYRDVCAGDTGFKETVRVEYDPKTISLDAILFVYFHAIDPTLTNRQGNDMGSQYQAGVYYADADTGKTVARIANIEKERASSFKVEIKPLVNFYTAEEYHQNYLDKNPTGYCHIPREEIAMLSDTKIDPGKYTRPDAQAIRQSLTDEQYAVTQKNSTEPSFNNQYWNFFEDGIYVDVVTGEPLFTSRDKFESSCGWPAFSAPIEKPVIAELTDKSFGMRRTEARSRAGNSHLGHVFDGDSESPSGTRYCINSAALRFIPYKDMEGAGYGYLRHLFDSDKDSK